MEKVFINQLAVVLMKVTFLEAKSMDTVDMNGRIRATIKGNGLPIIMKDKELFVGQTDAYIKDNGKTI